MHVVIQKKPGEEIYDVKISSSPKKDPRMILIENFTVPEGVDPFAFGYRLIEERVKTQPSGWEPDPL